MADADSTLLARGLLFRTGRRLGAMKSAAAKIGISLDSYVERIADGEKWCTACSDWHQRGAFTADRTRWDGLAARCSEAANRHARERYVPRPMPRGRFYVPGRDGDRKQARARVNHRVRLGLIPSPNDLPCVDCSHLRGKDGGRRHEYDHYLGYAAKHHFDVQAVCSQCHARRSVERGEYRGRRKKGI